MLGNKSPYELFYHKSPSLAHIRVIGCLAFATNISRNDKFAPKAKKAVFLGYAINNKGYKLLDVESKLVFVSRDVIFFEDIFPFQDTRPNEATELAIAPTIFTHTDDDLTPCVVFRNMVQNNQYRANDTANHDLSITNTQDQNEIASIQSTPLHIDSHVSHDQNQVPLV